MVFYSSHRRVFHVNLVSCVIVFILALSHLCGNSFAAILLCFAWFSCLLLVQVERESLVLDIFRCYPVRLFDCVSVFPKSGIRELVVVDCRFE